MTSVFCFSGSGHSLAVAEFLAEKLGCGVTQIGRPNPPETSFPETAIVVFPVYCQNIPAPVKEFLKRLPAQSVALIATYGRVSYGNVLWEAQGLITGTVIAGAYVPTGHTFLPGDGDFDREGLLPILDKIKNPRPIQIPRSKKDFIADVFPAWRSRMGVKLTASNRCNGCNICGENCPMGAIQKGKPNRNCIRCLRCVSLCPQKALHFQNSRILNRYLLKCHKDELILF